MGTSQVCGFPLYLLEFKNTVTADKSLTWMYKKKNFSLKWERFMNKCLKVSNNVKPALLVGTVPLFGLHLRQISTHVHMKSTHRRLE